MRVMRMAYGLMRVAYGLNNDIKKVILDTFYIFFTFNF